MKKHTIIAVLVVSAGIAAGCSNGSAPTNSVNAGRPSSANASAPANAASAPAHGGDETPASVKAAFPDAQNFTTQHKDVPRDAIAQIEKDTGGKVPGTDHHSFLAFSTTGGKRTQLGAATVVKAGGKDVVIVYENKGGSPYIREVRADGVAPEFLKQFAGKGHDDKFEVGGDIKANGVDDATAKAIAQAIRIDSVSMQTLYGAAHSH